MCAQNHVAFQMEGQELSQVAAVDEQVPEGAVAGRADVAVRLASQKRKEAVD